MLESLETLITNDEILELYHDFHYDKPFEEMKIINELNRLVDGHSTTYLYDTYGINKSNLYRKDTNSVIDINSLTVKNAKKILVNSPQSLTYLENICQFVNNSFKDGTLNLRNVNRFLDGKTKARITRDMTSRRTLSKVFSFYELRLAIELTEPNPQTDK